MGLAMGWSRWWHFEDDVVPFDDALALTERAETYLTQFNLDFLHAGSCCGAKERIHLAQGLWSIPQGVMCTQAILLTPKSAEAILAAENPQYTTMDIVMAERVLPRLRFATCRPNVYGQVDRPELQALA